ncbi:MAG: MFS transporter, partial [Chloroflexota bacterium]
HAMFSLGLAFGAWMGGQFVGTPLLTHFLIVGTVLALTNLALWVGYVDADRERKRETAAFSMPPRALWGLGLVAFCAGIVEVGLTDWSAIFLRDVISVDGTRAAYGITMFSLAMMAARLAGDVIVARVSRARVVQASGVIGVLGLAIIVTSNNYLVTLVGLSLTGAGVAVVIPLAFSVAGNMPGVPPGTGIAGVATIAYSGFLVGPPVIGAVAEWASLRWSFGLMAGLLVVMTLMAGELDTEKPKRV